MLQGEIGTWSLRAGLARPERTICNGAVADRAVTGNESPSLLDVDLVEVAPDASRAETTWQHVLHHIRQVLWVRPCSLERVIEACSHSHGIRIVVGRRRRGYRDRRRRRGA